jgi:hypothetical protein
MKYNIGNLLIFQTYLVDVPDDIGILYPNTRPKINVGQLTPT